MYYHRFYVITYEEKKTFEKFLSYSHFIYNILKKN
jgi:hypothetical protein